MQFLLSFARRVGSFPSVIPQSNPIQMLLTLPPEAITAAIDELNRDRSAMSRFSGQMSLKTN